MADDPNLAVDLAGNPVYTDPNAPDVNLPTVVPQVDPNAQQSPDGSVDANGQPHLTITPAASQLAKVLPSAPPDEKPINSKMSTEDILSELGYSDKDINKLKDDPFYKTFQAIDGDNWLSKAVDDPGSIGATIASIPFFGGAMEGANQTINGVAQMMAHAGYAIGLFPDTTPALFDALTKLDNLNYSQVTAPQRANDEAAAQQLYAAGRPIEAFAHQALEPIGQAVGSIGAGGALAGGVAAPLKVAGSVAKGVGYMAMPETAAAIGNLGTLIGKTPGLVGTAKALIGGAEGGAAMTANPNTLPEISQRSRSQYAQAAGQDAMNGAMIAGGIHIGLGATHGMVTGAGKFKTKAENARVIAQATESLRNGHAPGPVKAQAYQDLSTATGDAGQAMRLGTAAEQNVPVSMGDVTQGTKSRMTEKASRMFPFGMDKFRNKVQAKAVDAAKTRATSKAIDDMINAPWKNMAAVEKAAKAGDKKAAAILDKVREAGDDWHRVVQAEGMQRNFRKLLIKDKLYAKRDELAANVKLDGSKAKAIAQKAVTEEGTTHKPNQEFTHLMGDYERALSDPNLNTYKNFQNSISKLNDARGKPSLATHDHQIRELTKALEKEVNDYGNNVGKKYAPVKRYNIQRNQIHTLKDGGFDFEVKRPTGGKDPNDPGVRMYTSDHAAEAANATGPMESKTVKLKSPIVVEGKKGRAEFAKELGLSPVGTSNEDLTRAAIDYAKSNMHDGVVFTEKGEPRQVISLTDWKKQLGDATKRAEKFYKEQYIPARNNGIMGTLENRNPDEIVKALLQKDKVNKAENFYNALGDKGRAGVRAAFLSKVLDSESAAKTAATLHQYEDVSNVFFKGEDRWMLKGLQKTLDTVAEGQGELHGHHGNVAGPVFIAETLAKVGEHADVKGLVKTLVLSVVGGAKVAAAAAAAGKVSRTIAVDPKVRNFLLAASDTQVNSPKMNRLISNFTSNLSSGIGSATGNALQSGAPQ